METSDLYKGVLMEHYRHPRNKGDLAGADIVRRGINPLCGDEVEVGIWLHYHTLEAVKFRGRACSICLASASLMTEAVSKKTINEVERLGDVMHVWFSGHHDSHSVEPPSGLEPLNIIKAYPTRYRCVLLSWEALEGGLDSLGVKTAPGGNTEAVDDVADGSHGMESGMVTVKRRISL